MPRFSLVFRCAPHQASPAPFASPAPAAWIAVQSACEADSMLREICLWPVMQCHEAHVEVSIADLPRNAGACAHDDSGCVQDGLLQSGTLFCSGSERRHLACRPEVPSWRDDIGDSAAVQDAVTQTMRPAGRSVASKVQSTIPWDQQDPSGR